MTNTKLIKQNCGHADASVSQKQTVVVRGAGDLATGVICRLSQAGYNVVALETQKPTVIRRTVSLAEAVRTGTAEVEGTQAVRCSLLSEIYEAFENGKVAVFVDPKAAFINDIKPIAVVDAILAKKNLGTSLELAPVVIALGPGFTAGLDCHCVIETQRGHNLGRVIYSGAAAPNTGIPGNIAGFTHERVIHAPAEGIVTLKHDIGDHVDQNETIAVIGTTPVVSKLSGVLRGMIAGGTVVHKGMKIADVDPRDEPAYCTGISDKARNISGGVLEALMHLTRKSEINHE